MRAGSAVRKPTKAAARGHRFLECREARLPTAGSNRVQSRSERGPTLARNAPVVMPSLRQKAQSAKRAAFTAFPGFELIDFHCIRDHCIREQLVGCVRSR